MSKRETEKMVKEIWKDKIVEMKAGKHTEMAEFIFQHLQKRLGIVTAVIEVSSFQSHETFTFYFDKIQINPSRVQPLSSANDN